MRSPHDELQDVLTSSVEDQLLNGRYDLDGGDLRYAKTETGFDVWLDGDGECMAFATIVIRSHAGFKD